MTDGIRIIEIQNSGLKSAYTREILEALPEWFGNQQALDDSRDFRKQNQASWLKGNRISEVLGRTFSGKSHYKQSGDSERTF